jgi:AcrR family transcriptional regulator
MRITQAYKEATRSSLVQAGARLFAEHGFAETTLDQIAGAAGVARATFYNYFKSKEDVALAALEAVFDQLQADLEAILTSPGPWRSKVMQFFRHIVHLCSASPELLWVWCVESVRRGAQAPQMLIDLVAAGQACGAVRKDQSPDDMAIDLSGITFAQIAAWYRQGASADLADRLSAAVARYLDGVCPSPGENA